MHARPGVRLSQKSRHLIYSPGDRLADDEEVAFGCVKETLTQSETMCGIQVKFYKDRDRTAATLKVAIVDDSILIRRSLIKLVDQLDNVTEVAEATNVPEAIRLCGEFKPDVVVLDIRMPGGTGIDVLKEIKKQRPDTLVIMLTRYSTDVFRKEAEKGGAEHFFDKADEFEKVIDVIRDYKPK
jgi:CheY-like chemotaxis protein